MSKLKHALFELYKSSKVLLNRLLDRVIDLADLVLMDVYHLPGVGSQRSAHRAARYIGDLSWLLRDFPRITAYKLNGPKWTMIVVGSNECLKEVKHLFFEESVEPQELGRVALWKLSDQVGAWLAQADIDLVVCSLSKAYTKAPQAPISFSIPNWINQVVPIPQPFESLVAGPKFKGIRRRVNKAQKSGFAYRFSNSETDFDHFYHHMYVPFVKSRHDQLALMAPYEDQKQRWFARGGLVLVTQNNTPVAGTLTYIKNETCYSVEGGILQGDERLFQQGLNVFLIWCAMHWANEQGATLFNIGGTRPWLSGGSFKFKQSWGAIVTRRQRIYGTWTFLANNLSPALQQRINEIGFISELENSFYAVWLHNDPICESKAPVNVESLPLNTQGLDGVVIVAPQSQSLINK